MHANLGMLHRVKEDPARPVRNILIKYISIYITNIFIFVYSVHIFAIYMYPHGDRTTILGTITPGATTPGDNYPWDN